MTKMMDPLGVFMGAMFKTAGARPVPLVSTRLDIDIRSGLVVVTTRRTFRNADAEAIEAVMTFPVPVHGTLYALEATIDGRVLKAQAQCREAARATYEDGIDRGKAAILHEEILRGVHMLSVANLRPGGEIEVTTRWVAALTLVAGAGQLRIPMTVGDVYGVSALPDSDDLTHENRPGQMARISVTCAEGPVQIAGVELVNGEGEAPLNRPVDLTTSAWAPAVLHGRAADGRSIDLTLAPTTDGDARAQLTVLVDCSGSMNEMMDADRPGFTKHAAAAEVTRDVATALSQGDAFDLWEFNVAARLIARVDRFAEADIAKVLKGLSAPANGTEIGGCIEQAAQGSTGRDILLITDGMSHALDVLRLAQLGRRIHVLLIGEDSLEARVGHLAAMTGGEVFIATGANLAVVSAALVAAIRQPFRPVAAISGAPQSVALRRGGLDLTAHWQAAVEEVDAADPAVAAMASAMAMGGMNEARAAAFAEAEGLVTHLTSLVLVDDVGESQEGLPAMRKIALETPATIVVNACKARFSGGSFAPAMAMASPVVAACMPSPGSYAPPSAMATAGVPFFGDAGLFDAITPLLGDIRRLAQVIDWDRSPDRLFAGDVSYLNAVARHLLEKLAHRLPPLPAFAGVNPALLIVGLAALSAGTSNRTADRLARRIFDGLDPDYVEQLRVLVR